MRKYVGRLALVAAALGAAIILPEASRAQWLKYPTPGVPRTADGKPNMSAPAPRTADGKPDLSGIWLTNSTRCQPKDPESLLCGAELPMGREGINMGASLPGGLPYQPWLAKLVKERTADHGKDDPHVRCLPDTFLRNYSLPHLLKFVQVPGLLVMLDELNASYRQVFTDGRPLPDDPTPSWQGYSSGKWEGDTLVVNSLGFRDDLWIDTSGSMITSAARVQELLHRPDYGHLDVVVRVDDPRAYTAPWTVTLHQRLAINSELVDEICLENEADSQRIK